MSMKQASLLFLGAIPLAPASTAQTFEDAKLVASDGSAHGNFGFGLSVEGDRVLVGAPGDSEHGLGAGAAYVFERRANGVWLQVEKIVGNGVADANLGSSVSLRGSQAVLGAPDDTITGIPLAGAALLYERDSSGAWQKVERFLAPDPSSGDELGTSAAVHTTWALLGAPRDDHDSGSVYVFEAGPSGDWSVSANRLTLTAAPVPIVASGVFFLGPNQVEQPFGNGIRCVGGSILRLGPAIATYFVLSQTLDLASPPLAGNITPGST